MMVTSMWMCAAILLCSVSITHQGAAEADRESILDLLKEFVNKDRADTAAETRKRSKSGDVTADAQAPVKQSIEVDQNERILSAKRDGSDLQSPSLPTQAELDDLENEVIDLLNRRIDMRFRCPRLSNAVCSSYTGAATSRFPQFQCQWHTQQGCKCNKCPF